MRQTETTSKKEFWRHQWHATEEGLKNSKSRNGMQIVILKLLALIRTAQPAESASEWPGPTPPPKSIPTRRIPWKAAKLLFQHPSSKIDSYAGQCVHAFQISDTQQKIRNNVMHPLGVNHTQINPHRTLSALALGPVFSIYQLRARKKKWWHDSLPIHSFPCAVYGRVMFTKPHSLIYFTVRGVGFWHQRTHINSYKTHS